MSPQKQAHAAAAAAAAADASCASSDSEPRVIVTLRPQLQQQFSSSYSASSAADSGGVQCSTRRVKTVFDLLVSPASPSCLPQPRRWCIVLTAASAMQASQVTQLPRTAFISLPLFLFPATIERWCDACAEELSDGEVDVPCMPAQVQY